MHEDFAPVNAPDVPVEGVDPPSATAGASGESLRGHTTADVPAESGHTIADVPIESGHTTAQAPVESGRMTAVQESEDVPADSPAAPCEVGEEPWLTWDRSISACAVVRTLPAKSRRTRRFPVPAMPTVRYVAEHRKNNLPPLFNAAVARPVNRREIAGTPAARKAMKHEWQRLRRKRVWDESVFRAWADVAGGGRGLGGGAHAGYLIGICVEMNSRLAVG